MGFSVHLNVQLKFYNLPKGKWLVRKLQPSFLTSHFYFLEDIITEKAHDLTEDFNTG